MEERWLRRHDFDCLEKIPTDVFEQLGRRHEECFVPCSCYLAEGGKLMEKKLYCDNVHTSNGTPYFSWSSLG